MLAPRRENLGILGGALLVGALTGALVGGTVTDALFVSCLALGLLLALRHLARATRRWRAARTRAAEVAALQPGAVARAAVREERARLAADVHAVVRAAVVDMQDGARRAARSWDADPVAALRGIQRAGTAATSELRRMLGLLREPAEPAPPAAPDPDGMRIRPAEVVLAAVAAADVLGEAAIAHRMAWPEAAYMTPVALVLTTLAALTVLGRRLAPGASTLLLAALVTAGTLVGHSVVEGVWMLVTVGALGWACGAWERRMPWALAGPGMLALALVHKHAQDRPENLFIALVILGVGLLTGFLVRAVRSRAERTRRATGAREAELGAASAAAVRAERLTVARELHDLVSGAVGVVVMQAGAAEVLLATDRAGARRALDVVLTTCAHTLDELDRFLAAKDGAPGSAGHDLADLRGLVDRMRLAGLAVDLTMAGDASAAMPTVYRVVQESLLNTLRHAPGARAAVSVAVAGGRARVAVVDDGPGPGTDAPRGFGLVGIAERVQSDGGTLTTGTGPEGTGFRVEAELPLPAGPAPSSPARAAPPVDTAAGAARPAAGTGVP
ncbi:sensor histidine kinase [Georgenia thermotolerans]|uniref:histidine kinase n=1 Tax=Georgenia thermotolerans TaxID=527326 RepID=A0A7J5UM21_9MICO|nr:histidine kinase [Georgenia thermotolerans]KAE8763154.1 hypothetical protein GB883_15660 [Georgenia thermotolerans]